MDFTKPIKTQMVYCLECEQEVLLDLEKLDGTEVHTIVVDPGNGWDEPPYYEPCFGPFASCPPPDVPEEFDLMDEPSQEELAMSNLEAESLLQEVEG
jgi:hypothetical protein